MLERVKHLMANIFTVMFLAVAAALAALAARDFLNAFADAGNKEVIGGIIRAMNSAFISLATFELAIGIGKEYRVHETADNLYAMVRRTITRFVSVVCIALVLEGLIMVIKYSQLDMAGNLYYPVAVIAAASVLLATLGWFIHLSRPESVVEEYRGIREAMARSPAAAERGFRPIRPRVAEHPAEQR